MAQTTWQIDPSHSLVEFSVKHMVIATVKGRFSKFSGSIVEDAENLAVSSVSAEIDAASIDTRDEKRDGHLASPDFFDVQQFPTISFTSTRVEPHGGDRLNVIGDLTIHGQTRQVTLQTTRNGQGKNPWGQTVAGFSAETTISRKDFGLEWNVALETGGFLVGDNIKITLEIEAAQQA